MEGIFKSVLTFKYLKINFGDTITGEKAKTFSRSVKEARDMVLAVLCQAEVINCERDILPLSWSRTALLGLQGKVFNGQIGQQHNLLVLDLISPLLKTENRIKVRLRCNW